MGIRAAAFDLDDTLLRDDRTLSDFTVRTLRDAAAAGVHIIPASGRAHDSMWPYVEQLGCASLVIACNGAELWTPDSRLLHRAVLSVELAREVVRCAARQGLYCHSYDEHGYFYSQESEWARNYARTSGLKGTRVPDMEAAITFPVTKILMMAEPEVIARVLDEYRERFGSRAQVTCSKPWFLEINAKEALKGVALKMAVERLGVFLPETAAFGDSLNDLSMLEAAGVGVAMGNAWDEVKRRADRVCGVNEEDGAARCLLELMGEGNA